MDAIILCAGEGRRLRPMSLHRAKPLFPLVCKPILAHILEKLQDNGIYRAAANIWYRQEDFIRFGERVGIGAMGLSLVQEESLLGTGGGLSNAARALNPRDTFLVHNGDIYCEAPITPAIREHRSSGALITMMVRAGGEEVIESNGYVVDIIGKLGISGDKGWKYTGISIWEPDALRYLPRPGYSGGMIEGIIELIRTIPNSVAIYDIGDERWSDIGTEQEYLRIHRELLKGGLYPESTDIPNSTRISGFVCVCSGAVIESGCQLRNVLVWPDGFVSRGSILENAVVGPFGVVRV